MEPAPRDQGIIRAGIGGWTFAPWRGVFYPDSLPQKGELGFASRHVTTIEINATFYRLQSRESYRKWAAATPEGFVFSVKAPRVTTHRRDLGEAAESIARFLASGLTELGDRLGPIVWQFPPTKTFEPGEFARFLDQLPAAIDDRPLRHAIETRHASFQDAGLISLLRERGIAFVLAESERDSGIADLTADFVYARLQKGEDHVPTGYPPAALDDWAERAQIWACGGAPPDLPYCVGASVPLIPRDVFVYFIHGGKIRAPAAAMALIERV